MATIFGRKRKNGTIGYTAQIVLKREGKRVHSEAKTFDRKQAAKAWATRREVELSMPGALDRVKAEASKATLADVIDKYLTDNRRTQGATKQQVLKTVRASSLGAMVCSEIEASDILDFANTLLETRKPQTVQTYLSHMGGVFKIARPAWQFPLDPGVLKDARVVARDLGVITESEKRDRRPTLDEIDRLMQFFIDRCRIYPRSSPMHRIIAFAIFSARRLDEICRQKVEDYDPKHKRVMVRDMKHPGQKIGNDVWCDLPDPATAILEAMTPEDGRFFPFNTSAVGAAFTRACQFLEIEDLHFHDLRHEGASRLFELGWNIPHVATVTGHRSWKTLQRYTHIRQSGDKYADWKWLQSVTDGYKPTPTSSKPDHGREASLLLDKIFTPGELAMRWKCSPEEVLQLVESGALHHFRVGTLIRIPASAVRDFEHIGNSSGDVSI